MRQRHGLSNWYCALCLCVIGLALDHVAWAQAPNETYDFNISKGIVEFGRGHYTQAADHFEQARQAVPNDPEAIDYLGQTLLRLKKYQEAEALFHDLTMKQPARPQAWLDSPSRKVTSGNIARRWTRLIRPSNSIQRIHSSIFIRSRLA